MKKIIISILSLSVVLTAYSQDNKYPQPDSMTPGMTEFWLPRVLKVKTDVSKDVIKAPSDAIVLFDGTSTSEWVKNDGSPCGWDIQSGVLVMKQGTGDIKTKREFGDCQIHIEWKIPADVNGDGQGRGNSGLFIQDRYEIQILDSEGGETYSNGQAASIYKQSPPLVNATRTAGEWNVYDVIYKAPTFKNDGSLKSNGIVTVLHNGIVVQNNTIIQGTTEYIGLPKNLAHGFGAIKLQDHSNLIQFRNIWIRSLE